MESLGYEPMYKLIEGGHYASDAAFFLILLALPTGIWMKNAKTYLPEKIGKIVIALIPFSWMLVMAIFVSGDVRADKREAMGEIFYEIYLNQNEKFEKRATDVDTIKIRKIRVEAINGWIQTRHGIVMNGKYQEAFKDIILEGVNLKLCMFKAGFIPFSNHPEIEERYKEILSEADKRKPEFINDDLE